MNDIVKHEDLSNVAERIILEEKITKALPGLRKDQRTVIFIDFNNFEWTLKDLKVSINFRDLRQVFAERCNLVDCRAYWAFDYDNAYDQEKNDRLQRAGFRVTHKNLVTNHLGARKGNMDAELVMDVSDVPDNIEHIILFSGDQDFLPLIHKMRQKFKQVSICSTRHLQPPVIRHEVVRAATNFYDIVDLLPKIEYVPQRRQLTDE